VTAKATKTRKVTPTRPDMGEAEFRRWTPEEVVERQLLPYRTARSIREKCYRRQLHHHRDGGRITFTAEDLRRNNELGAVEPLSA
jgi:hypothetical protein